MTNTTTELRQRAYAAYYASIEADNAWEAELRRMKIDRWTPGSGTATETLRKLYEGKLAADEARREAADALRRA